MASETPVGIIRAERSVVLVSRVDPLALVAIGAGLFDGALSMLVYAVAIQARASQAPRRVRSMSAGGLDQTEAHLGTRLMAIDARAIVDPTVGGRLGALAREQLPAELQACADPDPMTGIAVELGMAVDGRASRHNIGVARRGAERRPPRGVPFDDE